MSLYSLENFSFSFFFFFLFILFNTLFWMATTSFCPLIHHLWIWCIHNLLIGMQTLPLLNQEQTWCRQRTCSCQGYHRMQQHKSKSSKIRWERKQMTSSLKQPQSHLNNASLVLTIFLQNNTIFNHNLTKDSISMKKFI